MVCANIKRATFLITSITLWRKQILIFSDSEITALSDQTYGEFMSTAKVSSDTKATKTLKEVGNKMVAALESYAKSTGDSKMLSGLNWEILLVESSEVNAFCLPNGKIVFYEGILKYADTPDYIAVVMGHEMAHAIARHGNERMSQEAAINLLGSAASEAIGNKKGAGAQQLFNIGFGLGSQAGYDIHAAPSFWEKMLEGKNPNTNDFFSTHPSDAKRINTLTEAIKTMPQL